MRKILASTFILFFMCVSSFAADLDIGTHASFYAPPEGGGNTLMTGVDATYRVGPYFSARGDIDNSSYQAADHKYSLTSLTITLIGHLMGASNIDPYVGAGIGHYDKNIDGVTNPSTGLNYLAGIAAHFPRFNAGIEIKYVIPDTRDMATGFSTVGANMTGGIHIDL